MIGALPLATIPPEDEALRPEIRAFLRETVGAIPPERRARSWMGFDPGFSQKLAERGWLVLLCHQVLACACCSCRQQGQRGRTRTRPTARRRRMVAIECGTCRSGRTGGAARPEASG